jgi:hypothetical protein
MYSIKNKGVKPRGGARHNPSMGLIFVGFCLPVFGPVVGSWVNQSMF